MKEITLTNNKIVNLYNNFVKIYDSLEDNLPIRIAFMIQFNLDILETKFNQIETFRGKIGSKYGTFNSAENCFNIPDENIIEAQKELDELMNIEQVLNIQTISLKELEDKNFKLTMPQMKSLFFMIEYSDSNLNYDSVESEIKVESCEITTED